ncbi:MAG: hypothetical protein KAG70_14300 [Alcanivorax sp.]|uniref:hypothetical protein n=1 Tax=Fulvimarina manganoxydans TaxID=937218 RepID=UPI002357E655|nr:hypothetical protein [Fulvimarina manganoxydans]MCK5887654.1 hypothetical protein [Alcanivorax sp.]MCK5932933.1 hypothetical protein [Fulvimarina manganoxydans]
MKYREARPLIRSGDLLAWQSKGLIGRFIRGADGGSWSHVGIAWAIGGRLLILEMREFHGLTIRPASVAAPFDWIATGAAWSPEIEEAALAAFGSPYGYRALIPLWLGKWAPGDGEVCSTWAAARLREAGVVIPNGGLTPSRLVEALIRDGHALDDVG